MQQEEWRYRLWRWGFIGMSVVAAAGYLLFVTRNLTFVLKDRNARPRLPNLPTPPLRPEEIPAVEEEGGEEEEKGEQ